MDRTKRGVLGITFAACIALVTAAGNSACSGNSADGPPSSAGATPVEDSALDADGGQGAGKGVASSDASGNDAAASDAAPDAAVDATPPFAPPALGARLVLWLDPAKGVTLGGAGGTDVARWADQSGNGNDATVPGGVSAPIRAAAVAAVGGHPTISFGGAAMLSIPESPSLVWATDDFSIFVVLRYMNAAAQPPLIVGKYDTKPPYTGPNLYGNFFRPAASTNIGARVDSTHFVETAGSAYNDGAMHVVGVRRSGATLEVRVDGASFVSSDAGDPSGAAIDVSAPGAAVLLGGRPDDTGRLQGDIAEIVLAHGTVTAAEIGQMEGYLRTKFAL